MRLRLLPRCPRPRFPPLGSRVCGASLARVVGVGGSFGDPRSVRRRCGAGRLCFRRALRVGCARRNRAQCFCGPRSLSGPVQRTITLRQPSDVRGVGHWRGGFALIGSRTPRLRRWSGRGGRVRPAPRPLRFPRHSHRERRHRAPGGCPLRWSGYRRAVAPSRHQRSAASTSPLKNGQNASAQTSPPFSVG